MSDNDTVEGRHGEWMHTASGGQFFPLDPRPEDIHVNDIANGLALDCRYGGQGRTDRFYSVAEHSWHMSCYARSMDGMQPDISLAVLFHDAAEAYINDLPRAVKHSVGSGYDDIEGNISNVILRKYGLAATSVEYAGYIKDLDRRIVPIEKDAIMRYPQPWAYDQYKPLTGVVIYCFDPDTAKRRWLSQYVQLCLDMGVTPEEFEV